MTERPLPSRLTVAVIQAITVALITLPICAVLIALATEPRWP